MVDAPMFTLRTSSLKMSQGPRTARAPAPLFAMVPERRTRTAARNPTRGMSTDTRPPEVYVIPERTGAYRCRVPYRKNVLRGAATCRCLGLAPIAKVTHLPPFRFSLRGPYASSPVGAYQNTRFGSSLGVISTSGI